MAAPAIAEKPVRKPLPNPPPGVNPEQFEVLASVCGVASWVRDDGSTMVGCRNRPPFQGPGEQPDGEIRVMKEFSDVCFLSNFYKGSFSAAGKEQAILGLDACGPDRANDISPGSVILVERQADGWKLVETAMGLNVQKCETSKRPDRTLLVCSDNMGAFGDGSLSWNFTLDFTKPRKQRVQVFSKLYKSASVSCSMGSDIVVERGLTDFEEVTREFKDVNNDGIDDLRITIQRAHSNGTIALGKRVDAVCQKSGGMMQETKTFLGKYQRYQLEFHGDATTLVPTPETAKRIEQWSQTAPNFWWNVVK